MLLPTRSTLSLGFITAIVIILLIHFSECATKCYAGRNTKFISRPCGSGGSNSNNFTCQKFICEGGKSPFVLRTCANKRFGCVAGPAICRLSGGIGSCARCDTNNCNI